MKLFNGKKTLSLIALIRISMHVVHGISTWAMCSSSGRWVFSLVGLLIGLAAVGQDYLHREPVSCPDGYEEQDKAE